MYFNNTNLHTHKNLSRLCVRMRISPSRYMMQHDVQFAFRIRRIPSVETLGSEPAFAKSGFATFLATGDRTPAYRIVHMFVWCALPVYLFICPVFINHLHEHPILTSGIPRGAFMLYAISITLTWHRCDDNAREPHHDDEQETFVN